MPTALVAFMRSSARVDQVDCGIQSQEASYDERSASLQGKCAKIVETPKHWTML